MYVQIACPERAGTVRVEASEIALLPKPAPDGRTPYAVYALICPACDTPTIGESTGVEVLVLKSAGASKAGPQEAVVPAAEMRSRDLPPLTYDDLLDFHHLLDDECWARHLDTATDG